MKDARAMEKPIDERIERCKRRSLDASGADSYEPRGK